MGWIGRFGCRAALALGFASALFGAPDAAAAVIAEQYHHSAWGLKDGAPADIWALAQTPDGFLWLGTGTGFYRFDGVRFERIELPLQSNNLTALFADDDGSLWLGDFYGGIAHYQNGQLRDEVAPDTTHSGIVYGFAKTPDGAVWAASLAGLLRWADGRWQRVGSDWAYPAPRANHVFVDHRGVLWVSSGQTILFLQPGARAFERTGEQSGVVSLAESPDGRLWLTDENASTRTLPDYPQGERPVLPAPLLLPGKRLRFDRDGALWLTDAAIGGVVRIVDPAHPSSSQVVDRFSAQNGLTADVAVPLLEDRDGNIWVGTNLGLNRFRRNAFLPAPALPKTAPFGFALTSDPAGGVWVAHGRERLLLDRSGAHPGPNDVSRISSLYRAPDGVIWLGGDGSLQRRVGGRWLDVSPPAQQPNLVQAMTEAPGSALWVSFSAFGVYEWQAGRWRAYGDLPGLPHDIAQALVTDDQGRVWFGYAGSRIAVVDHGEVRVYGHAEGLDIGNVTSLAMTSIGIIAGGEAGIARFDGSRFASLPRTRVDAFSGVSGIVADRAGELWLNGLFGIVRITPDELLRALSQPRETPTFRLFNSDDGVPGVAQQINPVPTAIRAEDGRLWFATNHGVVWTDPALIARNPRAPTLQIREVSASGEHYAARAGMALPQRTSSVQIDYTGLDLTAPERLRFRYRLDEAGEDWQDAGNRRYAIFTNLGPGRHRFQVIAANGDGVWNLDGATLEFTIRPTFAQTTAFKLLCAALLGAAIWLLYWLRLRQLTRQLYGRLEERYSERERIARELHDTLLQGVQGLVLQFHVIARQAGDAATRGAIERTLDRADVVLEQGRDRVRALRGLSQPIDDLATALRAFGEDCAGVHGAAFTFLQGPARPLDPIVRDEICQIAREALFNAFQHAAARQIEVELACEPAELRLVVRDDGQGIASEVLNGAGRPGHWGLAGMRERAQRIGAALRISSELGRGTQVELRVPAASAYGSAPAGVRLRHWLSRRLRGIMRS